MIVYYWIMQEINMALLLTKLFYTYLLTYCTRGDLDTVVDRGLRHTSQVQAVNNPGTMNDGMFLWFIRHQQ
ncbi:uncharacterized protein P174DRAFT_194335 [Aspergillus novofumigatus IBT 16806]|uniref:Uncharacterized protein n=1 Tax=Aspergillus novofumigatus (strain IBT 16806) TaxID=1392255 RepID=A0A2I1CAT5_ASPN1|nr:uncharacterized protein P174DRAFT_194335 [Aspergillus novofumigatus IBT 16806]PKX94749.1 hypothetical protein P174DRAFT_194335 [Aspergillus novofumigatus IBT 16806]